MESLVVVGVGVGEQLFKKLFLLLFAMNSGPGQELSSTVL